MADAPARPPQSAAAAENPFASWDSVPLFMKSLPSELGGQTSTEQADQTSVDTLAALQALAYDGTPAEIAAGFKEQGNELFVKRKFKDAAGFYSRALDEVGKELSVEDKRTLWSNRAACNLELGNYGSCLRDTSQVLGAPATYYPEPTPPAWNKTTQKALLRASRALLALDKLPEAQDTLQRLRLLEEEMGQQEQDVGKRWRDQVEDKIRKRDRREGEKAERDRRKREGDRAIQMALMARGAVLPKVTTQKPLFHNCPVDVEPPHFDPESLPPTASPSLPLLPPVSSSGDGHASSEFVTWTAPPLDTALIIPVFLLLPLATPPTRDLCLGFHTSATFGDALRSMEHDPTSLNLYIATRQGRVLKVGQKLELGKVMLAATGAGAGAGAGGEAVNSASDGWELKEGWALEMVGVPKGAQGDEWIQQWKAEVKEGARAIL